MLKKRLIPMFLMLFSLISTIWGDSFFLYSYETLEGEPVLLEESAKEGVMENIFDAGHIIFDDISKKILEIPVLLDQALEYGAGYLIVLIIQSRKKENTQENDGIISEAAYYLYDTSKEKLIGKGSCQADNLENGTVLSRSQFWYKLGFQIAEEIKERHLRYLD